MRLLILIWPAMLSPALFYLLASFTAWDFNPASWEAEGRFIIAALAIVAAGLSQMFWILECKTTLDRALNRFTFGGPK